MKELNLKARLFVIVIVGVGAAIALTSALTFQTQDAFRLVCYLLIAIVASGCKITLPGVDGTMSVNFLFILLAIPHMTMQETVLIGCASTLVQSYWNVKRRPKPVQVTFNFTSTAIAIAAGHLCFQILVNNFGMIGFPIVMMLSAITYFVFNTGTVAMVISLTDKQPMAKVWRECYFWSFSYYLVGAGISGLLTWLEHFIGWQTAMIALPAVYAIYRSYRLYLGKLETEKQHVEDMASLHLRTIEALALAIEAKDHTTHAHLRRVRVYAVEVARHLSVPEDEIEALKAAALLHDIGKLAVPEHIISKPGRLTPEEFEKMKIHPIVGAEILERVQFPYPVVPIVRSHHERWDGSGYPEGLKGEEIPIGARILATVDCLDALASDRQYRRALPLAEAMRRVVNESGTSFDPKVVEVLEQHFADLEQKVQAASGGAAPAKLSTDVKVERGAAPAAGFEQAEITPDKGFLKTIAAARQEAHVLIQLTQDLNSSMELHETFATVAVRIRQLIPFDGFAVYLRQGTKLVPSYVEGENQKLFASLQIPIGQGLSGWVAQNKKPIINGNPSVEPGYLNDPSKFSTLRSALSAPLDGASGTIGVITLYHAAGDAFTRDHLRILLALSSKIGNAVESAMRYREAAISASTDYLTGLANARTMFQFLDGELNRSRRTKADMSVLICDLDGFKQVNDRFGHLQGNEVLKVFSRMLQENCREYDFVARMGGDEFVLILPGCGRNNVQAKVMQLRDMAQRAGREVCNEDVLDVSIGCAFARESGYDAETLLAEADRAMYTVKQEHHRRADAFLNFNSPTLETELPVV